MISKQELAKLEDVLCWLPAPTKLYSLVCTSYKLPGTQALSVAGTVGVRTLNFRKSTQWLPLTVGALAKLTGRW